ncbi:MAG: transcriptional regulator, partial [Asticcacaulis sp.]|nr:transcriptional regulator [Asticcacaulis sp.]
VSGPEVCLDPSNDFLYNDTIGATGGLTPAYNNLETNNAVTRADPNRWTDVSSSGRRGGGGGRAGGGSRY